jgi:hypothetical protein
MCAAARQFILDTLKDDNVRIYRHTDGKHETCNTRSGKRRVQGTQYPYSEKQVQYKRDIGYNTARVIVNQHQEEDNAK